ncbi:RNA polymerase sigma factor [Spirosoma agri]|uniref:RNA polymerase sigma factor n=1 Tax=Spirosoma agri TaxID=1987381 RepID=A0A6M0IC42_9BACT|nr:sigma-70 family RNA polymerase sigma factor [Spirosoma agri]NEU65668.1 sigma-70 family RNA polymerase sigma factor [Spirosoma agri]
MALLTDFDTLHQTYYPKVLKLCLGYTGDYAQAQDLAQETFVKVWQNLAKFKGESLVSTWLYRIAVNTCLNHLRTARHRPTDALQTHHSEQIAEETGELDQQINLLYKCISQLAETDRLIISLVLEDTPYTEIAQIAGISDGNLRVKIHRIKQQLTDIYHRYGRL